jgi:CheY-like chemotaxis protein
MEEKIILFVENSEALAGSFYKLLPFYFKNPVTFVRAKDGEDLLRKIKDGLIPEAIITCAEIGVMSNLRLSELIPRIPELSGVCRIILSSGIEDKLEQKILMQRGYFFQVPVRAETLYQIIKRETSIEDSVEEETESVGTEVE